MNPLYELIGANPHTSECTKSKTTSLLLVERQKISFVCCANLQISQLELFKILKSRILFKILSQGCPNLLYQKSELTNFAIAQRFNLLDFNACIYLYGSAVLNYGTTLLVPQFKTTDMIKIEFNKK